MYSIAVLVVFYREGVARGARGLEKLVVVEN